MADIHIICMSKKNDNTFSSSEHGPRLNDKPYRSGRLNS